MTVGDWLEKQDPQCAHLIGRRVRVLLARADAASRQVTEEGTLQKLDIGGEARLLCDDGTVRQAWPVLEIEVLDDAGGAEGAAPSPGGRPQDGGIEGLG